MSHKPTDEQAQIIDAFAVGDGLTVAAGAGSGKTSTLRMVADRSPRRRGLYLAYNRSVKDDAARTFPATVRAQTSHGLAYGPVATRYRDAGRAINGPRVPAQRVAEILRINEPVRLAEDTAPLAPQQLARIALATVAEFCKSGDLEITADHVPLLAGLDDPTVRRELGKAILPYAHRAWADILDRHGRLRFEHNHYLKIFQLSQPRLRADYLLVDEAQDLNPCVAAIAANQTHMQVVYVGDQCQAINGWNGAVDAMATAPGRRLYLTQSFRFGQRIADEANKWLSILHADMRLRGFDQIDSRVDRADTPDAVLCRTNATAFSRVMAAASSGRRTALVGGGDGLAALARAAKQLQANQPTDHPEWLAFSSWREVQQHVEQDDSASDMRVQVKLVDQYGPDVILATADRLVPEQAAEVVISTAHKSKGREWPVVQIADDFVEPRPREDGRPGRVRRADAMLAYVAVTRARTVLDRHGLSWVDSYVPGAAPGRWYDPAVIMPDAPDELAGVGDDYRDDPAERIAAVAEVAPEFMQPADPGDEPVDADPGGPLLAPDGTPLAPACLICTLDPAACTCVLPSRWYAAAGRVAPLAVAARG
jgi:hypothetical protein